MSGALSLASESVARSHLESAAVGAGQTVPTSSTTRFQMSRLPSAGRPTARGIEELRATPTSLLSTRAIGLSQKRIIIDYLVKNYGAGGDTRSKQNC
jgi:hypothetical protein